MWTKEEAIKIVKQKEKEGYKSDLYSDGYFDGYATCMDDIKFILSKIKTFELEDLAKKYKK